MKNLALTFIIAIGCSTIQAQTSNEYFSKAAYFFEQGHLEDAVGYCEKVLAIEKPAGKNQYTPLALATIMLKGRSESGLNKYDAAISSFSEVLKADPKEFGSCYHYRGEVKLNKGDYNGAITDLNKALELNDQNQTAYFMRATAYKNLGKTTEACDDMQRSAQLGNAEARKEALLLCK